MGVLYRGMDPVLDREVAIKLMLVDFSEDEEHMRPRFYREARAIAKLQHRNIVTVFEFAEEGTTPYIVMEFLRGTSLAARMKSPLPLSLDAKLDIVGQLLTALDYAHEQGVVHRDVKPANVFVLTDGAVKLLDFGIAKLATSTLTRQGDILGSASYMSPEQVSGDGVDGRSDIFSAGVVLYELLAGRKPFQSDAPTGIIVKILHEAPPPIDSVAPGLPAALVAAVNKSLAKKPEDRFATAGAFANELQRIRKTLESTGDAGLDETRFASPTEVRTFQRDADPTSAGTSTAVTSAAAPAAQKKWLMPAVIGGIVVVGAIGAFMFLRPGASASPEGTAGTPAATASAPAATAAGDRKAAAATGTAARHVVVQIQSEPAGAEISVDGHDTKLQTPASVSIAGDRVASSPDREERVCAAGCAGVGGGFAGRHAQLRAQGGSRADCPGDNHEHVSGHRDRRLEDALRGVRIASVEPAGRRNDSRHRARLPARRGTQGRGQEHGLPDTRVGISDGAHENSIRDLQRQDRQQRPRVSADYEVAARVGAAPRGHCVRERAESTWAIRDGGAECAPPRRGSIDGWKRPARRDRRAGAHGDRPGAGADGARRGIRQAPVRERSHLPAKPTVRGSPQGLPGRDRLVPEERRRRRCAAPDRAVPARRGERRRRRADGDRQAAQGLSRHRLDADGLRHRRPADDGEEPRRQRRRCRAGEFRARATALSGIGCRAGGRLLCGRDAPASAADRRRDRTVHSRHDGISAVGLGRAVRARRGAGARAGGSREPRARAPATRAAAVPRHAGSRNGARLEHDRLPAVRSRASSAGVWVQRPHGAPRARS